MVGWATVLGFSAGLLVGCESGTNPKPIQVPPSGPVGESKPLPGDVKKGGGASSSGNMKVSPADSS
jgi:hypothetical protein